MVGMFALGAYRAAATAVDAAQTGARAASKVNQLKGNIRMLEANLAKAMMINEAVWEIVRDKFNITDEELQKKVEQIDMRDGILDGKNQRKATECPNCGHTVSARHPACIYCGQIIDNSIFSI